MTSDNMTREEAAAIFDEIERGWNDEKTPCSSSSADREKGLAVFKALRGELEEKQKQRKAEEREAREKKSGPTFAPLPPNIGNTPEYRAMRAAQGPVLPRGFKDWPYEEQAQWWHERSKRQHRAWEAYKNQVKAKRNRRHNPAPRPILQFAFFMPTHHLRDTRLTMGARVCLVVLKAVLKGKKEGKTTIGGLALLLGVHYRTAQRYLMQLEEVGAIHKRIVHSERTGMRTCLLVRLLDFALECLPGQLEKPRKARKTRPDNKKTKGAFFSETQDKNAPFLSQTVIRRRACVGPPGL